MLFVVSTLGYFVTSTLEIIELSHTYIRATLSRWLSCLSYEHLTDNAAISLYRLRAYLFISKEGHLAGDPVSINHSILTHDTTTTRSQLAAAVSSPV